MLNVEGQVTLKSQSTGETFDVDASDIAWEMVGGDERGMGTEYLWQGEIEFKDRRGNRVSCTWQVSEYPVGVYNNDTVSTKGCEVEGAFEYHVTSDDHDDRNEFDEDDAPGLIELVVQKARAHIKAGVRDDYTPWLIDLVESALRDPVVINDPALRETLNKLLLGLRDLEHAAIWSTTTTPRIK